MPIYEFTAPDGKTYEVEVPEGVSEQQAFEAMAPQMGGAEEDPNWAAGLPAAGATEDGALGGDPGQTPAPAPDPSRGAREELAADMPWYEQLGAGMGQSVDSNIRGMRQLYNMATGDDEKLAELQQEEALARESDDALKSTGFGKTGQISGHLMQMLLPAGAASRGAKALTMAMPRAAQTAGIVAAESGLGGAYGALQPTVEGESHADNAAVGAAFGGAARMAPMALGAAVRGVGNGIGVSPLLRTAAGLLRPLAGRSAEGGSPSVRAAAGQRLGEITSGVRVPIQPLARELSSANSAYTGALPRPVRAQLDALSDWAQRYPNAAVKGDKIQEMRTALYREASERGGMAQSGLERIGRALDSAVEGQLTRAQLRALRQARTEYRTGMGQPGIRLTAPATVAGGTASFLSPGPE